MCLCGHASLCCCSSLFAYYLLTHIPLQGVTTALALQEGLSSPLFAVSFAFSSIVMYDAMGVRQHAGKQAAVLNQVRGTVQGFGLFEGDCIEMQFT